jgi:hypothetical protein
LVEALSGELGLRRRERLTATERKRQQRPSDEAKSTRERSPEWCHRRYQGRLARIICAVGA